MTMASLVCFSHACEPSAKVAVFSLPPSCPLCQLDLSVSPFAVTPFTVPTPFASGLAQTCSIILKPTKGDFLHTFVPGNNLHVGIVDSKGRIVSFDSPGVAVQLGDSWPCHLPIVSGVDEFSPEISSLWDLCVEETVHQYSRGILTYDPDRQNCFDFVIFFLQLLVRSAPELSAPFADQSWWRSKDDLIEDRIKTKMMRISKYISIYRHVAKNGFASF